MSIEAKVLILKGQDLSAGDLSVINKARLEEFGSTNPINPQPDNEDWEKKYFLVKNANNLLAFGRLHKVDATFMSEVYHVLGIATMIATDKGKGYGKLLAVSMADYIRQTGQTGLGFCDRKLSPFYHSCGFGIIVNGKQRFVPGPDPRFPQGDAINIVR